MVIDTIIEQPTGHLNDFQVYSYTIADFLSFLSGMILLFAYLKVKKLRERPGFLILMLCESYSIQSFYQAYTGFHYALIQEPRNSETCLMHGALNTFLMIVSWNFALSLSIEVLILASKRIRRADYQYTYYQIFAVLPTTGIIIVIACLDGFGLSINNTCLVKQESFANLVMWIFYLYLPVYLTSIIICFYSFRRHKKRIQSLTPCTILTAFTLLNLPFTLEYLICFYLNSPALSVLVEFMIISKSLTGFILCLLLLTAPEIREIMRKVESTADLIEPLIETENAVTQYQEVEPYPAKRFSDKEVQNEKLQITLLCLTQIIGKNQINLNELENQTFPWAQEFYGEIIEHNIMENDLSVRCDISPEIKKKFQHFNCKVIEYAPTIFFHMQSIDGISQSDIVQSLLTGLSEDSQDLSLSGYPTRSLHSFSFNSKFLLKEISPEDKENLVSTLPAAHTYISQTSRNKSLLVRVLGLFTISIKSKPSYDIVILENIIPSDIDSFALFELKGTKLDRQVLSDPSSYDIKTCPTEFMLKDLDFSQIQKAIHLSYIDQSWVRMMVHDDVEFLSSFELVEYSLFLAVAHSINRENLHHRHSRHVFDGNGKDASKVYILGIMDTYSAIRTRHQKSPRMNKSAEEYSERFLSFFNSILKCDSL
ncbi:unnamed protein product [Blepharisma stoltei]|uniref:PIPK domain-containing protein n=1 Tax=Blepharisma stoltei TaxID=1481888 RepID=A0AAU9IAP6_9CILI|nr:unnamed protein product [Blepharisma stoltei]